MHAAAEAARALDFPFTLTARAENLVRGRKDLDDTIRRLQAFEAAGADVPYAPGLTTLDEVRLVASALTEPLNVLAPPLKGETVALMADAGARRISTGGLWRVPPSPRCRARARRCSLREVSGGRQMWLRAPTWRGGWAQRREAAFRDRVETIRRLLTQRGLR